MKDGKRLYTESFCGLLWEDSYYSSDTADHTMGGAVVSKVTSQQQGPEFKSRTRQIAYFTHICVGFLPQPRDTRYIVVMVVCVYVYDRLALTQCKVG